MVSKVNEQRLSVYKYNIKILNFVYKQLSKLRRTRLEDQSLDYMMASSFI
jgi:hypothetical protein